MKIILHALIFFMSISSFAQNSIREMNKTRIANPQKTNPALTINSLFLYRGGTGAFNSLDVNGNPTENASGFRLQEAEIRGTSNIDTYLRGDVVLAIEQEDGEFIIEPEEIFVETLSLPNITIRVGKFYTLLGRHNNLHHHAFPFVDGPLTNETILGEEGLNESGVFLSYLLPTPWYFEAVAEILSASNEELFNSPNQDDVAALIYLKNLWDLSDSTTFEFIFTYGRGANDSGGNTDIYSGSVTYRWRPIKKSIYRSFLWTTEFLQAAKTRVVTDTRQGGISSWIQYQFKQRWWAQARGEYLGLPVGSAGKIKKYSGLIGWVPTEYSSWRVQYDLIDADLQSRLEHRVSLQLNVSLGTHPAHLY